MATVHGVRAYSSGENTPVDRTVTISLHPDIGFIGDDIDASNDNDVVNGVIYNAHGVNKTMDWEGGEGEESFA